MRDRSDIRTLLFVAGYYALTAYDVISGPHGVAPTLLLVVLTASASWVCAVVAHNALHCPVFESRRANDVFQVVLSCAYGFPVSEYEPGHNLSHHRHTQKAGDVMRTSKAPFVRFPLLNLLYFFPRVGFDVMLQNYRYGIVVGGRRRAWLLQRRIEILCSWGSKLALLAVMPTKAVLFVFIPHFWAIYGITTVNILQHDGCDEDHPFNHSRNFVGRIFNWLTFNNGFHGVHHEQPRMHWSQLRQAHHDRYHGRVAPALEQRSLLLYLIRTFVFSTVRRRYDGTPMPAIERTADEEWIPAPTPVTPS